MNRLPKIGFQFNRLAPHIKRVLLVLATCLALFLAFGYYLYSQRYISTEDAYINANVIQIASRINGQIAKLYTINNQYVHNGQPLFDIDATPFIVAMHKAQAQLAIDKSNLHNARTSLLRIKTLLQQKLLPPQSGDDAQAKFDSAAAQVSLSEANLAQAELDLQYTQVKAGSSGWVTNMSLQTGNLVSASQALFALVSESEFWVDTNLKETELMRIKPGQKATIKVDMYPHKLFHGVVESISAGSGNAFALLPAQNATGNWVKITQRVPVRVKILDVSRDYPLRLGTTASVSIDLHSVN